MAVDAARSRVVEDWHRPEGKSERRTVELRGELAPGTRLSERSSPFARLRAAGALPLRRRRRAGSTARARCRWSKCSMTAPSSKSWPSTATRGTALPIALTPAAPPSAGRQQGAIDEWADGVIAAAPALPENPATDILLPPAPADAAWRRRARRLARRRRRRDRARRDRPRSQLPRRAGPSRHRQDVRRLARDRASRARARLQDRRGGAVPRGRRAHARPRRGRGARTRPGRQGAEGPVGRRHPVHGDRQERHGRVHRRARRDRLRRRRHRVGLRARGPHPARQPRPARDRRGRPVLARLDDRRLASRRRGCCCSATRSSCRRSARARTPSRSTPRRSAG